MVFDVQLKTKVREDRVGSRTTGGDARWSPTSGPFGSNRHDFSLDNIGGLTLIFGHRGLVAKLLVTLRPLVPLVYLGGFTTKPKG